jgi:hypothetical protein
MDMSGQYDGAGQQLAQAAGPPKPLSIIDGAIGRLSLIIDRLSSMTGMVKEYTDGTRGMDQPAPGSPVNPSMPPGALPRGEVLQQKLEQLESVTQQLSNQLNRLSGI